jgi:hypothetical protein
VSWRSTVARLLAKLDLRIVDTRKYYAGDGLFTLHHGSFLRCPRFRRAYARGVQASKGVDPHIEWRVHVAIWAAQAALHAGGDFVECGVNAGFISSSICEYFDWNTVQRDFWLIDTFAGPDLEQFSSDEVVRGRRSIAERAISSGAYVTDVERVRSNFSEWPRVRIVQGRVPDVLDRIPVNRVAFLHIDLNCAAPEVAALQHFASCLDPAALVLLDDYAYFGHEVQRDALDSAAPGLGLSILTLPTGQGLAMRAYPSI